VTSSLSFMNESSWGKPPDEPNILDGELNSAHT
jgi:hypothetical protein